MTGAYHATMASNYNAFPRLAAVLVDAGEGYVSHLRRLLEEGPGDAPTLLVTRLLGYALLDRDVSLDAMRFEQLAGDGRRASRTDSRGRPWPPSTRRSRSGVVPPSQSSRSRTSRRRRSGGWSSFAWRRSRDRADALLRLGRHAEVVGPLASLVAANPLRERLRGQWMLALYRSGRQADALEAYRDGRRLLSAELGLDPMRRCNGWSGRSSNRTPRSTRRRSHSPRRYRQRPVRCEPGAAGSSRPWWCWRCSWWRCS